MGLLCRGKLMLGTEHGHLITMQPATTEVQANVPGYLIYVMCNALRTHASSSPILVYKTHDNVKRSYANGQQLHSRNRKNSCYINTENI